MILNSDLMSMLDEKSSDGMYQVKASDFWKQNELIKQEQPVLFVLLENFNKTPLTYRERVLSAMGAYFGYSAIPEEERGVFLDSDDVIDGFRTLKGWRWSAQITIDPQGRKSKIPVNEFAFETMRRKIASHSPEFAAKFEKTLSRFHDPRLRQAFEAGVEAVVMPFIVRREKSV